MQNEINTQSSPIGEVRLTVTRGHIRQVLGVSDNIIRRLESEGRLVPIPGLGRKEKLYRACDVKQFVEISSAVNTGTGN